MWAAKILFAYLLLASGNIYAQEFPEYTECLKKANDFYDNKEYANSTRYFSKAFALNGGQASIEDRYIAACSWARIANNDSAFYQLLIVANNIKFTYYKHLIEDSDLQTLHTDKRWQTICEKVMQNKEKAEVNFNKPLVAILDTVFQNDQDDRNKFTDIQKKYGYNSKQSQDLWKKIEKEDSIDLIKVENILDRYGWLGTNVIGSDGNSTLFLVIQHSSIKVQEKYLPIMRDAVKKNNADPADLALLEDRVALGEGKKQIYGSQLRADSTGHYRLSPLEDPDNVDKRRAEVGLPPLADYLQQWNIKWDVDEYKKQQKEIEKMQKGK